MAIDNENKRRNVAGVYPSPDGDISGYDDRRHLTFLYRGVGPEVATGVVVNVPVTANAASARVSESVLGIAANIPVSVVAAGSRVSESTLGVDINIPVTPIVADVRVSESALGIAANVPLAANAANVLLTESVLGIAANVPVVAQTAEARVSETTLGVVANTPVTANAATTLLSENTLGLTLNVPLTTNDALSVINESAAGVSLNVPVAAMAATVDVTEAVDDVVVVSPDLNIPVTPLAATVVVTLPVSTSLSGGTRPGFYTKRLPRKKLPVVVPPMPQPTEPLLVQLPSLAVPVVPLSATVLLSDHVPAPRPVIVRGNNVTFVLSDHVRCFSTPASLPFSFVGSAVFERSDYPTPEEFISLLAMAD